MYCENKIQRECKTQADITDDYKRWPYAHRTEKHLFEEKKNNSIKYFPI